MGAKFNHPLTPDNATSIAGVPVSPTAPTDGQVLEYVQADNQWKPVTLSVSSLRVVSITITQAIILALPGNGDYDFGIGSALPTGARLMGFSAGDGAYTPISDVGNHAWTVDVHIVTQNDTMGAANVASATATGLPVAGTPGPRGYVGSPVGGLQMNCHLHTTAASWAQCTGGNVTVSVLYSVP